VTKEAALARRLTPLLLVPFLVGCAAEVRELKPEEQRPLAQALQPLLRAAYGADAGTCRVGVEVVDSPTADVQMAGARDGSCQLALRLTSFAATTLTPRALQTLLAHELGHVQGQHALGRERHQVTEGRSGRLQTSGAQFSPEEEADADARAARLLTVAYRGSNVGCLALADMYEDIAKHRGPWGAWLSRHPFPERRVEAVVKACDAEQQRR
jgi:Zn-dependent protease with chaperone function